MGNCFGSDPGPDENVDVEERRRRAAEAAEQRQKDAEGKGLKDPEAYKRKIEQREKIEREAAKAGGGDGPLKWNVS